MRGGASGPYCTGLADKAFRSQAEQMLSDGKGVTAERAEKLKEIQGQLNLPDADAQKIIKGITSGKMLGGLQAQIAMGTLTIADLRKMKEEGAGLDWGLGVNNSCYSTSSTTHHVLHHHILS